MLLATISMSNLFEQAEKATYKTVAHKFEDNYNPGRHNSLFNLFSTEMQNIPPLNKTKTF